MVGRGGVRVGVEDLWFKGRSYGWKRTGLEEKELEWERNGVRVGRGGGVGRGGVSVGRGGI